MKVDKYDRFKSYIINKINEYKKNRSDCPKSLIIAVLWDKETKNLHEIYGVLEKINDGVLESNFAALQPAMNLD